MFRLFAIIYALTGPTLAGILMVAVLSMNMFNSTAIIYSVAAGFIIGLPVAFIVARKLTQSA
ncbi:hypothetical protein [Phaeovulum vinaykumarii]|uniref:CTP synthetase n=1 Tax=Phaeovulum vinaykumarii TaxID=407234 RepID=A0A1N7L5Q9_9RHOB|nr:hypothetical protein [Phaeovulum vinaykumarii]SIS69123.1 hypothetical protein SAMN05421795_102587 [Phaeovulum vinaykumarii]SOB99654.1 hypothetical protein SAMN05878426_102185 [Phaeovulum vinaykumarii]